MAGAFACSLACAGCRREGDVAAIARRRDGLHPDLLGLRRSFLLAGARTVISSLWSVRDDSTAELMDLFYRNLWQRGMGRHEALRAAQLEIIARQRAEQGFTDPATWGAFVLDGDWR